MIKFKLSKILKKHSLSQNQFAKMANIRPNTINDMCNNTTKRLEISTLNKIMETLCKIENQNFNISDLIEYEKTKSNKEHLNGY